MLVLLMERQFSWVTQRIITSGCITILLLYLLSLTPGRMTAVQGRRDGDDNKLTRLWPAPLSHQPKLQVLTIERRRKVQQERYLLRTSLLPLHHTKSTEIPIHPGQFYFIFLFWSGLFWSCCGGLMSSLSTQYGLSLSGILMSSPPCLLLFSKSELRVRRN